MEVLILSKTKYGSTQVCIGGICIENKQFIRLLNSGGYYQPVDTAFNIGDIWDINFTVNSYRREPHNEDVTIHNQRFIRKVYALESFIKNLGIPIWKNDIINIFEGKILWQRNGKGYFSENIINYPKHSVGFWVSDVDLRYFNGSYFYEKNGLSKQIIYKGSQVPLPIIPQGKLIRLSLAKWWKPEDLDIEERCYLQLSGWYDDLPEPQEINQKQPEIKKVNIPKFETQKYELPKINTTTYTSQKNTSGSCYIATLCYEDYYAEEVCRYRDFRDNTLKKYKLGRVFISKYYKFAPKLTDKLKNKQVINSVIKYLVLNPLLKIITILKLDRK